MKTITSLFSSPSSLTSMLGAGLLALSATALAQDPNADGRKLLAEGNTSDASKKFAEAAKVNPFDASALNNQAVALAAQGDTEKALNLLERANRLSPNRADIAANLNELRNWMNRNTPQVAAVERKAPVPGAYPIQGGDIPPEPPPLWKK